MQRADSLIAAAIVAFSAYCMWHAWSLPIGWVDKKGPGGGAFPFWLSAIMLVAALVVLVKSLMAARKFDRFFDSATFGSVAQVTIATMAAIVLMQYAGAYVAMPLFVIWYVRVFGRHSWLLTLSLTLGAILVMWLFFEVTLQVFLPKGPLEPLFVPLYAIFF
ncbi:MAG: tripartite tricarboxylate transporter TctB family protein [Tabrizicola sp.]|nr:tripartite tricarboxylate transporter TctB family protein [Tabrizicola sp.]